MMGSMPLKAEIVPPRAFSVVIYTGERRVLCDFAKVR
jgi:hypothetical protein